MSQDALFVDDLPSDAGDDAPLVVLVHGTMDRHSSFARVRSRLMASCHVVSYDRRGYGASREATPPAHGMEDHAADLERVVDGRRCVLVGHSYGGTVVLTFAARHPELASAIVVYEPPLAWLDSWPSHNGPRDAPFEGVTSEEAAEGFVRRIVGEHRYDRLPLKTREDLMKDGDALIAELTAIRSDPPPFELAQVTTPVLVARGEHTARHHLEGTQLLVDRLPSASLRVIAGAGHGGHQSHPNEFSALVLEAVALSEATSGERSPT